MQIKMIIKNNKWLVSTLLLSVLSLSGCGQPYDGKQIEKAPAYVHPKLHAIGELPPYKIRVGDTIEVKFLYNEEFNQEIIVRPDGRISTAAVQSIKAYGRTPADLSEELTELYKQHLKKPYLSVLVTSFTPTKVYVLGEVTTPGEYESVEPNPSLMQLISRAGDLKATAHGGQILIVRKDEVDQPTFYLASYDDIANGMDVLADVQLTSHDVVYVPKTAVANVHEVYQQYIRQFIPASIGVGYSINSD